MNIQQNINSQVEAEVADYIELLKPKVMRLVLFTAAVALVVAPGSVNPIIAFATLLCVAAGAGAAGALNMWWDSDIDVIMKRTSSRPIPSGRISSEQALAFGIGLSFFSITFLGLFANWIAAGLLAFTILFYILIYTMWLKRLTPQNIVIGGAAGAFPPMIGWSIATGGVGVESVLMFLLIFIWTPPHFWTLALFINKDFISAKVPMLTVTHGKEQTRKQILVYSILLFFVALSIAFSQIGGPIYFIVALALNIWFLLCAFKIYKRSEEIAKDDQFSEEKKLFVFSIFYLFSHFTAIGLDYFFKGLTNVYIFWPQIF